jgi:uncharacterized protein (DUF58 family)
VSVQSTQGLIEELSRLGRLHVQVRRLIEAMPLGAHAARGVQGGGDFVEHRAFRAGDEPARVDWRASARSERVLVREQRAERRLMVHALIDTSASMKSGEPVTKWRYGCWLGLAAAYCARRGGDAAELHGIAGDPSAKHRLRGIAELESVADRFEAIEPAGQTNLYAALEPLAALPDRGMAVIVSDLLSVDDQFWKQLAELRSRGWHLAVMRVLAEDELNFAHTGPIRFTGLEGEEPLVVDAGALRQAYLEELERFDAHCIEQAAFAGVRLIRCDTGRSPLEPLRSLLEGAVL